MHHGDYWKGRKDQNVNVNSVAPTDQAHSYEDHCDLGSPFLRVGSNNFNQSSHQSSMRI